MEFGALPDDFATLFRLLTGLWEREVGARARTREREEESRAQSLADQYAKTRRVLQQQME